MSQCSLSFTYAHFDLHSTFSVAFSCDTPALLSQQLLLNVYLGRSSTACIDRHAACQVPPSTSIFYTTAAYGFDDSCQQLHKIECCFDPTLVCKLPHSSAQRKTQTSARQRTGQHSAVATQKLGSKQQLRLACLSAPCASRRNLDRTPVGAQS